MKIGVVGAGFVGSAVINAFDKCEIVVIDPAKSDKTFADLEGCQCVFVCVPSPMSETGHVDASILYEVVEQIPHDMLIIVKSTVTPDHLMKMAKGRKLIYNPEFLTQRSANEDFLHPDSLIFGGDPDHCAHARVIYDHYSRVDKVPVFITNLQTASLIKYTLNCHFAAKVIFMNEIYHLHQRLGCGQWEEFKRILSADTRLGPTHLEVPGPDGYFGYGGACFPKDTAALFAFGLDNGVYMGVLDAAIRQNQQYRNE